ncbi:MAG TPA: hypothetical protein ENH60_12450 [Pricia sp.]|nr:hypothetical protein [Pricia sp.]
MMAGGLIVPCVPKVFYSIPERIVYTGEPSFDPLQMLVTWNNGQSGSPVTEALLEDYKALTHFIPEAIVKELNLYKIDTAPLIKRLSRPYVLQGDC